MTLKARIQDDMKSALRARDADRLSAIRMLLAAIKQREVDERRDLSEAEIAAVIDRLAKQRRDSIEQFRAGGRDDLARRESFELDVLTAYLPRPFSDDEIDAAVDAALAQTGASGPQDMGKVMAVLKPQLAGRADLGRVSARVRSKLA